MSAFSAEECYILLELTLISTKIFSDINDTTDFLLFTSSEFEPHVRQLAESINIPLQIVFIDII